MLLARLQLAQTQGQLAAAESWARDAEHRAALLASSLRERDNELGAACTEATQLHEKLQKAQVLCITTALHNPLA
jgi:hypothetical protein